MTDTGWRLSWRWYPYVAICTVHLLLLAASAPLAHWTHLFLMPPLLLPALLVRPPLRRWVLGAIALAWIGDTAPRLVEGQAHFLVLASAFLLGQLTWVLGLGDRWSLTLPARRPATAALYLVAAVAIMGFTVPFAGALAPAVVLCGVALTAAAILASSLGDLGTWGGVLFMVADTLLVLKQFLPGLRFDGQEVLIMFTYVVAQGLLVAAATRVRPGQPGPAEA